MDEKDALHQDPLISSLLVCLAKQHTRDNVINDLHDVIIEQREGGYIKDISSKDLADSLKTVGFIGKGYHTGRLVWPKLHNRFVVGGVCGSSAKKEVRVYSTLNRTPEDLLSQTPVDLLVVDSVDKKDYNPSQRNKRGTSRWF